jgi:hypothetical protein
MPAAAKTAAEDDSTMQSGTSKQPDDRPPMTAKQHKDKQARQLAASAANPSPIIAANVTIARLTSDISAGVFDAAITLLLTQVAAGMAMKVLTFMAICRSKVS